MQVLFLTTATFSAIGGIPRYTAHLCKALSEMPGCHLDIFSLCDRTGDQDVRYLPLHWPQVRFVGFDYRKPPFVSQVVLQPLMRSYNLCLVGHVHLLPLILPMKIARPSLRCVMMAYGIEVWQPLSRLQKRAMAQCEQILAISEYTAQRMQAINGKSARISILNNCLDPYWKERAALSEAQARPAGKSTQARSLLTVSRLMRSEAYKGHAQIIQALPAVRRQVPDVRYDIVGGGDLVPELQQLAVDCGVEQQVHFYGEVDEPTLHHFYRECDLFVMPSKNEGFGYVYLEAMFYGKPVLAGSTDAGREVVHHNHTGLVVDPDDQQALTASLIDLLEDSQRRQALGLNGKREVEEMYTFERFKHQLHSYLRET